MKLLVVDDQGPVGEIISRVASQAGWESLHSVSVDRLDERIVHDEIDVLMLDFAIDGNPWSERNGLAVLREIREKGHHIPAILFSGWTNRIDRKEARKLGVIAVLEKPISIQELRRSLDDAARAAAKSAASKQSAENSGK